VSAAFNAQDLKALAKSREPADRERLLLAIVDLCARADQAVRAPAVQELLGSIFMSLVAGAEHDIRHLLADKLALADWPPVALVNVLALDDIEIARPIIACSPVLRDSDLVRLLVETTIEHQIEVARRPCIGPPVVETILSQAEPPVLTALAGNDTADITPQAMLRLVEASRQIAGMRSPLVRHPRLTTEMAQKLYAWVGQSLRSAIVSRFRVDVDALDKAIAEAVNEAHAHAYQTPQPPISAPQGDQEEMEQRLITKLHAAGQLRPSYMLRALRDHKLSLFVATLATLGAFTHQEVRRALKSDRPEILALACAAVGVDKSAFGAILSLVRELNGGGPGGDLANVRKAFNAFGPERMSEAGAAFRKAVAVV
jgi:uncharacterized protein (DUF2336 family)